MKEKLEEIRYNRTIKNIEYLYYMVPFKFNSKKRIIWIRNK